MNRQGMHNHGIPMGPGGGQSRSNTIPNRASVQQLQQLMKASGNTEHQRQLLTQLLKQKPSLMSTYIKLKEHSQLPNASMSGQPPGGASGPVPSMSPHHQMPMRTGPVASHQMQQADMWHMRGSRPGSVPPGHGMYPQQAVPPGGGYQPQMGAPRPMHPHAVPQYGGGQRYPGPDSMMGPQQQQMRPTHSMHHSQMLQQVRSPPTSMPQHTRSPQPMPSPRQQATASPAMLQHQQSSDSMGGMMPNQPPQHMYSGMNVGGMHPQQPGGMPPQQQQGNMVPPQQQMAMQEYDQAIYGNNGPAPPPQDSQMTASETLNKFVESL